MAARDVLRGRDFAVCVSFHPDSVDVCTDCGELQPVCDPDADEDHPSAVCDRDRRNPCCDRAFVDDGKDDVHGWRSVGNADHDLYPDRDSDRHDACWDKETVSWVKSEKWLRSTVGMDCADF